MTEQIFLRMTEKGHQNVLIFVQCCDDIKVIKTLVRTTKKGKGHQNNFCANILEIFLDK